MKEMKGWRMPSIPFMPLWKNKKGSSTFFVIAKSKRL